MSKRAVNTFHCLREYVRARMDSLGTKRWTRLAGCSQDVASKASCSPRLGME
jgi:hypothetical protein